MKKNIIIVMTFLIIFSCNNTRKEEKDDAQKRRLCYLIAIVVDKESNITGSPRIKQTDALACNISFGGNK